MHAWFIFIALVITYNLLYNIDFLFLFDHIVNGRKNEPQGLLKKN